MATISDNVGRLTQFAAAVQLKDLPDTGIARAKASILDALACGVYGSEDEQSQTFRQYVMAQSASAQARIWAGGQTTSFYAAMVNSMMVRRSGLAEGHEGGTLRPSSVIVPALLAAGDRERATGSELLAATVAGYEVMLRFARAVGPALAEQGLESSSIAGTFAAAAAVARLMQLDAEGVGNAMSVVASHVATGLASIDRDTLLAGLLDARAAANGVMAGDLVRSGITGPTDWAEAWLAAVPRRFDQAALDDGVGSVWLIAGAGIQTMLEAPGSVTDVTAARTGPRSGVASANASFDQVSNKTRSLVKSMLPLARYETLIGTVRALEKLDNVRTLTALMSPQAGTPAVSAELAGKRLQGT